MYSRQGRGGLALKQNLLYKLVLVECCVKEQQFSLGPPSSPPLHFDGQNGNQKGSGSEYHWTTYQVVA